MADKKTMRQMAYEKYHQPAIKPIRIKTNDNNVMPIMECFGPTIQGEGMVIGQKTIFLRTGGCDYKCAWCDSSFTWNGTAEPEYMSAKQVYDIITNLAKNENGDYICKHVTLTGGNPALIQQPMQDLIDLLKADGFRFSIETQGTCYRDWFKYIDDFVLSPKPPSSMMKPALPILDKIVAQLEQDGVDWSFKIVIMDEGDLDFAKMIISRYKQYIHRQVYLSVGNEDAQDQGEISQRLLRKLEWLWDLCLNDPELNDARPLPQLHTLVYNNRRAV